ncbi:hypothetical protein M3Y95_00970200 [Aphelenchoides besseyi]|nr:hypothetical protein M3Y95_00970200 [Aphelenchoides besseyi]
MDHWRQISGALDYKQYQSLKQIITENEELAKAELDKKMEEWAEKNGLTEDYKIFSDIQKEYRNIAEGQAVKSEGTDGDNEMSKIIAQLAKINDDQSISFKEACRRQNALVRETNRETVESLGLQNLINTWCD